MYQKLEDVSYTKRFKYYKTYKKQNLRSRIIYHLLEKWSYTK